MTSLFFSCSGQHSLLLVSLPLPHGPGLDAEDEIKHMEQPCADEHDTADHDLIHHDEGNGHHDGRDAHHRDLLPDAQPFTIEKRRHMFLIQRLGIQPVMKTS